MVGTNTDIDEQKRIREELRERTEFQQQLVGIVSHDLRNPLASIIFASAILDKLPEPGSPRGPGERAHQDVGAARQPDDP